MLSARDIGYHYGEGTDFDTVGVEGVDLDVHPGTLTLVAGDTGSGKTTLLRLLSGIMPPSCGSVSIDGAVPEPAASDPDRRTGLLFQRAEAQLFEETVFEDVEFGPKNLGRSGEQAREDARRALALVRLDPDEFGPRSPFTLSGGEARRVALAGVLAMRPRYLLLDEPTAGLDADGREAVRDSLAAARRDQGVVVVTHDVEDLMDMADAVLVLRGGRTVFTGSVDEYVTAASHEGADVPVPEIVRVQLLARARGIPVDRVRAIREDVVRALARASGEC
jgi:energy-coupling factor transport system ATP-binding protein